MRTESTRLIWPAPMPTVGRSLESTIALERTCLQTFQANSISPHSASVGLRSVTTSIAERSSRSMSRSCTSRPPMTRLRSRSAMLTRRRSLSSRMRIFGLRRQDLERLLGELRREDDLAELLDERLGERAVDRPVEADDAAEGATCGSHAKARS